MSDESEVRLQALVLAAVPEDGSAIGAQKLREQVRTQADAEGIAAEDDALRAICDRFVEAGVLLRGRGRGGSLRRADPDADPESFSLETQDQPQSKAAAKKAAASGAKAAKKSARKRSASGSDVLSYRHTDKRVNNPPVGLVSPESDPEQPRTPWRHDPHIDPELQFDIGRAQIEKLIDDALASGDQQEMYKALEQLRHMSEPYLNWAGKAEGNSFEVDLVSLHVHERVDPATILATVRKRMKDGKGREAEWRQPDMFSAPFENLPLRDAVDFYRHEKGWSNRLIAGDSLLVMNSLLQKENMAGQVQMIYIDPPYGIKYGSNFQPFVNKRDVKDRSDEDLTQEPEMIKAFRDTWELGIHSYLTYLRDRLLLAKELLHESGSVFVQISDENIHHVRELMDEVMGSENMLGLISFQKTGGLVSRGLPRTVDYLCWYAKDVKKSKVNQLYVPRRSGDTSLERYDLVRFPNGFSRRIRKEERGGVELPRGAKRARLIALESANPVFNFIFNGRKYGQRWKTNSVGLQRLCRSQRLASSGTRVNSFRYVDDFPVVPLTDRWESMQIGTELSYVVQTAAGALENCILMTTDPGDLVLDPTCGSGTTAYVAEKWGRRWITTDTSRVAITLAKQRLMTASYDYFELKYPQEGLKGGFIYKTVPHVTLKAIANNPEIDEIYEREHPKITAALDELNAALKGKAPQFKVGEGGRKGQGIDFSAPEGKTVELPSGEVAPVNALLEWEVPFDFPEDWPQQARAPFDAFHAARQSMQKKMDDSIANHADQEVLYDQPEKARDKLRISGPFSVEAVPFATVLSLDEAQGDAEIEADAAIARSGESSRQHEWRDELLKAGIRGKNGQILKFADLEPLPEMRHLHCTGSLAETGERVVVSFGPEHAALEARQVKQALDQAEHLRPSPKFIVFCAFTFDPEAAKDIDETHWPGVTLLKAQMNTDLLTEDLKKKRATNQSFWLMGQPDVGLHRRDDGSYQVEVNGFDYFDTSKGELVSGGKSKIAVWSLDTDYDGRSLFPSQVFFPMAGSKDGWYKLKRNIRAELDESKLEQFHGTVSLPFEAGENAKVAVKIVDDRGIESLKVIPLDVD